MTTIIQATDVAHRAHALSGMLVFSDSTESTVIRELITEVNALLAQLPRSIGEIAPETGLQQD